MAFKRRTEPTTIDEERDALRAQHAALEDLKRQLADRISAVREREVELHHALADIDSAAPRAAAPVRPVSGPPAPGPPAPVSALDDPEADTGEDALEAARREQDIVGRERALDEREALLGARTRELAAQAAALGAQTREAEGSPSAEVTPAAPSVDADEARLARIESRLEELKDAEKLFLRTRDELAARSEAVAARERLVGQRERELDEREDAEADRAAAPGFTEMEARLRRLEQQQQQQDPREQTLGFSGGLRKLEQGTRQQRPG